MTAQTLVSIYTVNERGYTADRLGTGSLLDPRLVLAHPAAAARLAANASARVRVGIAAAWWPGGVEVIDVKTVRFGAQPYVDLVALELARRATSPFETLDTGETVDEFAQTLRKHL